MAEARTAALNRRDKVLPSLLDRLLGTAYAAEGHGLFVSPVRYLESIRRDLYWLLKTEVSRPEEVYLTSEIPEGTGTAEPPTLASLPQATASVLAYGIPAQRGAQGLRHTGADLARAIKAAIQRFEPRIDPATVRVTASVEGEPEGFENASGVMEFNIRGIVRMRPVSEELMLKAIYLPALAQWRIEGVANEP